MHTARFIKSFSKGQITIPKELREALGITSEFWLKIYIQNGKIIAEPIEEKTDKSGYKQKLLQVKQVNINTTEITRNRQEVEQQVAKRAL